MSNARRLLAAILWISPITACASILDIQNAQHDPSLDTHTQDSGGGGKTLCERYCDAVMKNCVTPFQQYTSAAVCLDICAQLPPGAETDDAGNSVGCRLHYAMSAGVGGELNLNCPAAGPGGNGICGANCEGLCKVDSTTCTGSNSTYADQQACLNDCKTVPDIAVAPDGGQGTPYNVAIISGNSVQCRLYHLGAAQTDPTLHCAHVAGSGPCLR